MNPTICDNSIYDAAATVEQIAEYEGKERLQALETAAHELRKARYDHEQVEREYRSAQKELADLGDRFYQSGLRVEELEKELLELAAQA
jgi:predicted RNase H-like nuclease (RuvC/YqgF family)